MQIIKANFQLINKIRLPILLVLLLVLLIFVFGILVAIIFIQSQQNSDYFPRWRNGIVERIIDGDTIVLSNGEIIRYLDIDSPETVHPQKPLECYGLEATKRNEELVKDQKIFIDVPNISQDKYGRTLAYIYTDNYFVNGELIFGGYAYAKSFGQPGKLYQTLIQIERLSRENNQGLWGRCYKNTKN